MQISKVYLGVLTFSFVSLMQVLASPHENHSNAVNDWHAVDPDSVVGHSHTHSDGKTDTLYLNHKSIEEKNDYVYFSVLLDLVKKDHDGGLSYIVNYEADCKHFKARRISYQTHKNNMAKGDVVFSSNEQTDWHTLYKTPIDAALKDVCKIIKS